jgi:hypothetical protein
VLERRLADRTVVLKTGIVLPFEKVGGHVGEICVLSRCVVELVKSELE